MICLEERAHLSITVVGALRALLATGAGRCMCLPAAGKVQYPLLLAVVKEEVEGPDIPHLTCTLMPMSCTAAVTHLPDQPARPSNVASRTVRMKELGTLSDSSCSGVCHCKVRATYQRGQFRRRSCNCRPHTLATSQPHRSRSTLCPGRRTPHIRACSPTPAMHPASLIACAGKSTIACRTPGWIGYVKHSATTNSQSSWYDQWVVLRVAEPSP